MGIQLGICGVGAFAQHFIPLFKHHPGVDRVVLSDLDVDKLAANAAKHGIPDTCPSLDALCEMDIDAIAIITQHHLHGPQALQALHAGKHVYSAVPSAITIDEMRALVRAVEETGKVYMIGETSYYYPCAIYCRDRFQKGDFGHAVYAEAEYYHDYSHGLYDVARWRHGKGWRKYYGMPPFFIPSILGRIIKILREAGAKEIHMRVGCPPIKSLCKLGIDMPTDKELIASDKDVEKIRRIIGADTLRYLEIEELLEAIGLGKDKLCLGCLTGEYPVKIKKYEQLPLSTFMNI